tara:strand:- start:6247 stop:7065 length:819 start_codon:yes stop_codon:yes gene_type:complete
MNRELLISQIKKKKSFLCIGLDTDFTKIPSHLLSSKDPIFNFNKAIIDATCDLCVAYKPNIAFYESMGSKGWDSLKKTLDYIPKDIFTIADAKRGDIGNTSSMYAKTFFEYMDFDSITVSPYMGSDSVLPFLNYKNKWVILLALTSNVGSQDFQNIISSNNKNIFEEVIEISKNWGTNKNMMYVVGATQVSYLSKIRRIIPDHFLLIPGVGAQGGDIDSVVKNAINKDCGLLVNSSRNIIYASSDVDFADQARIQAKILQEKMSLILTQEGI